MSKTFVIGDREKNEWLKTFNPNEKMMAFTSQMDDAMTFEEAEVAKDSLDKMQQTGYFTDLGIYLLEDGKAYIAGERDSYQPID